MTECRENKTIIDYDIYNVKNEKGKYVAVNEIAIVDEFIRAGRLRFVNGEIAYFYKDNYWQCDAKGVYVKQEIRKYIINSLLTARRVNSVYENLKQEEKLYCNENFLKIKTENEYLIPFIDCVLDVINWKLLEHKKEYNFTYQVPTNIKNVLRLGMKEIETKASVFLQFLDQNCKSDEIQGLEKQKQCLLEYIGFSLIPSHAFKKALIVYGRRDSGKSVLINAVKNIVGEQNVSNVELQELQDRFKTILIKDKLLNVNADLNSSALDRSGTFKKIIGGDTLTAEYKGVDAITFTPYCKQIYATNEQIKMVCDKSDATIDKIIYINFNYVPKKKDVDLINKIIKEKEYITVLACICLHKALKRGEIVESEYSKQMKNNVRKASDSLEACILDLFEKDAESKVKTSEFHKIYEKYCEIQGQRTSTRQKIKIDMDAKGYTIIKPLNVMHYKGLKLKNIEDIEDELKCIIDSSYSNIENIFNSDEGIKVDKRTEKKAQESYTKILQYNFKQQLEKEK